MIFIFLREVNKLNYNFTPDYNRYKWMAQNIFSFVGQKRAKMLAMKSYLNIDSWIPFKHS
jgi:hypothetical protein